MTQTRLREVPSAEEIPAQQPANQQQQANASLQLLLLALKTLSQRTLIAIAALRGMILAGTVFWATLRIIETPSVDRLVCLGLYGLFVLCLEIMGRK